MSQLNSKDDYFYELIEKYEAPLSSVVFAWFSPADKSHKENYTAIIVDDPIEQDGTKKIYHTTHPLSKAIISAILCGKTGFEYNNFSYHHLRTYFKSGIFEKMKTLERATDNFQKNHQNVLVYVYRLKGICRKHKLETERVVVNIQSTQSKDPHPIEVYYCPKCDKYYINYEEYQAFCGKYGLPTFRINDSELRFNGDNYSMLSDRSELNLYGYDLSKNSSFRCALLEDLIDTGFMTKASIIAHLEFLIRFGRNNPKNRHAILEWQDDLEHVRSYNQDHSRNIFGEFTPHE